MRLIDGFGRSEGRVEVYISKKWGTVQYDPSGYQQEGAAQAICRRLGFYDVANYGPVTDPDFK